MTKPRTYYQLMPERIKEALPTIEALIRPEITGYCSDYLKEVISILCYQLRKDEEAAPIVKRILKILVPQGDKYLNALFFLGIIQRSGHPKAHEGAYKYSFTPEYDSKFITGPFYNAQLIYRIEKAHEKLRKENANTIRGHSEQVRFLRQLTIAPGFMTFINENYATNTDAYNRVLASATRIMNGDIFYSIDSTSGRFHSNVTNCPAGFRPYLRVKGQPLVNIDVKNCQPYLSTLILTDPLKASIYAENPAFAMVLQTLKVSQAEDVMNYIKLVINGTFYEYLMQEFAVEGLHMDRQETKRQVLRILFARNRSPKDETNRKARGIFKARFPSVHKIFSKVRGSERGDKFTSFKRFAILLQRMESYLMLDVILKRIYKELPDTIAITIHDSVMTGVLTNDVEAVKNIITEELTFFVGFRPNVRIEGNYEIREEKREENSISKQYDATTFVKN